MKTRHLFGIVGAAVLTACSPQPAAEATPAAKVGDTRHPVSGLEIIPLTVSTATGERRFGVEVAASPEEQRQGLMHRTELADDEGMIFPSNPPQARSFWMKNTPIPLDIIFIGSDGRILNIHAMTTPYALDSYASDGVTSGVLEIRGGLAAELGIAPGDKVMW